MREILNYPETDNQKLETVKKLIDSIAEMPDDDKVNELSHITGKHHTATEFAKYWGWTDLDTLAKTTLTPEPPYIRDLTQNEIAEIVSIIKTCLVSCEDNKAEYYMELLHRSMSLPNVLDFIMSENDTKTIAENIISASSSSVIAL